jgi:hypothetical protein
MIAAIGQGHARQKIGVKKSGSDTKKSGSDTDFRFSQDFDVEKIEKSGSDTDFRFSQDFDVADALHHTTQAQSVCCGLGATGA